MSASLTSTRGLAVNVAEAIWAKGGDVLTSNGTVVVDAPEAKAGIAMLADGIDTGWIPRSALTFNEEDSREAFQQGSALFLRNWPYVYRKLADPNSPVSGIFAAAALPGPSALGGWNLGVSSCSTHRRTARDFIKFVTSEANQRKLFELGGFAPTVASVYNDPELRQRFPYIDLLQQSVQNSRIRPATLNSEDVSEAIQEYVGQALHNPLSVDAMAEKLAERLATVMRRR
jgi:multiple sugar transport system substrate-binding protein